MTYSPTSRTLWGYNEAEAVAPANFWQDMMKGPYSATSGNMGIGLRVGTLRCYQSESASGTWANFATVAKRTTSGAQSNEVSAHDGGLVPYMSSSPPVGRQSDGRWGYRSICDKANHATAGAHTGGQDAAILAFANRIYQPYGSGGSFNWGAAVDPNAPGGQYGGTRSTWMLWGGSPHEPDYAGSNKYGFNDDGSDPGISTVAQRYIAAQEHIFDVVEARRVALGQPLRLYFFHIITGTWDGTFAVPTAYRHGRGMDMYFPAVSSSTHYTESQFRNSFWDYPKFQTFLSAAQAIDGTNVALAFGEWAHGDVYNASNVIQPHYPADFIRNNANKLLTTTVADGGPRIWTFPWFQSGGHRIDPVGKPENFKAFHDGAVTLAQTAVSVPAAPTNFSVTNITTSTADINMLDALPAGALGWNVYKTGATAKLTNSSSTTVSLPSNITFWHITSGTTSDYWQVTVVNAAGTESAKSVHIPVAFTSSADTTPPPVPAAPTVATPTIYQDAAGTSLAHVAVSWVASTASDIGTYGVYVGGVLYGDRLAAGVTSVTVQGLALSATVLFTVDAADTTGNTSAQSPSTSVTMPAAPDTTPPTFPTANANLAQTVTTAGGFTLACDAATDTETGVQFYEWLIGSTVIRTATNLYTATGLQGGVSGTAQVRALDNASNVSAWSTPAITTLTGQFSTARPTASCVATPTRIVAPGDISYDASGSGGGTGALTFWFDPDDGNAGNTFPALFAADGSRLVLASGVSTTSFTVHYATARTARPRLVAVDTAGQWDMVQITVQIGWPVSGFTTSHGWAFPLPGDNISARWMKDTLALIDAAVSSTETDIAALQAAVGGTTLTPTRLGLSWIEVDVVGTGVVTPTTLGISWADVEVTV